MKIDRDDVLKAIEDLKDFEVKYNEHKDIYQVIISEIDEKGETKCYAIEGPNIKILLLKMAFEKVRLHKTLTPMKKIKQKCHNCDGAGKTNTYEKTIIDSYHFSTSYMVDEDPRIEPGKTNLSPVTCQYCKGKGYKEILVPIDVNTNITNNYKGVLSSGMINSWVQLKYFHNPQ